MMAASQLGQSIQSPGWELVSVSFWAHFGQLN
jgi:hypothetical protein